jgi:hypothetical protein
MRAGLGEIMSFGARPPGHGGEDAAVLEAVLFIDGLVVEREQDVAGEGPLDDAACSLECEAAEAAGLAGSEALPRQSQMLEQEPSPEASLKLVATM